MARDVNLSVSRLDSLEMSLKPVYDTIHSLTYILQVASLTLDAIYQIATLACDIFLTSVGSLSVMARDSPTVINQGAIGAVFSVASIACVTIQFNICGDICVGADFGCD